MRASKQNSNRNHNLTYGEVVPVSIEEKVLPALGKLTSEDVFYDLGSGSGKIPLQVALQTNVGKSAGIEFARQRATAADRMWDRLASVDTAGIQARARVIGWEAGQAEDAAAALADALAGAQRRLSLIHGDFIREDISDATVVFINNAVFEPDLMAALLRRLAELPRLKRVVCLRKLCYRCGRRCDRRMEPCTVFQRPPKEATIRPTWTHETTLFTYIRHPKLEHFWGTPTESKAET